jgi:hypothetical protein
MEAEVSGILARESRETLVLASALIARVLFGTQRRPGWVLVKHVFIT